jgi:hypothetical protein
MNVHVGRVHLLERNVSADGLAVLMGVPLTSSVADVARDVTTPELLSIINTNGIAVESSSKTFGN